MTRPMLAAAAALALFATGAVAQQNTTTTEPNAMAPAANTAAPAANAMAPAGDAAAMDPQAMVDKASQVKTAAEFVPAAAVGNQFEILTSQAALSKGSSENVKMFAQHMIEDHGKAAQDLMAAVADSGTNIAPPQQLDAPHQAMFDQLNGLTGAEFDTKYIELQRNAHNEAVALFTSYSQSGDNDALKTFATKTLPTLQEHKTEVDALNP